MSKISFKTLALIGALLPVLVACESETEHISYSSEEECELSQSDYFCDELFDDFEDDYWPEYGVVTKDSKRKLNKARKVTPSNSLTKARKIPAPKRTTSSSFSSKSSTSKAYSSKRR